MLFFRKTRVGKGMEATSENREAATLCGISVNRTFSLIWAVSSGLAAAAGVLLAPLIIITPDMGTIGIKGFIGAILGGFTSIPGAIAGCFLLGIIENLGGVYIASSMKDVIAFFVLVMVLSIRPNGLFGIRARQAGVSRVLERRMAISTAFCSSWDRLLAPYLLPNYPLFVLSLAIVNIIAVLGVNLVMGYAGQISLGHAGFAAIGAYTTALLVVELRMSRSGLRCRSARFWPPHSDICSGLPALRLGPLYVSMVTFGFGLIVVIVVQNWYELANGPNGLVVPPPELFGYELFPRRISHCRSC